MLYTNELFTCQDWNYLSCSNECGELLEAPCSVYGCNQLGSEACSSFNSSSLFDHNRRTECNFTFTNDNCDPFRMLNDADKPHYGQYIDDPFFPQQSQLQLLLKDPHLASSSNYNFQNTPEFITPNYEVCFLTSPNTFKQENLPPSQASKYLILRQGVKFQLEISPSMVSPEKCTRIDLSVSKLHPFDEITLTPWTTIEEHDRRRIVRISRVTNGPNMELEFLIVLLRSAREKQSKEKSDFIEVSCLKFTDANTNNVEYLVTALEVVRIVEMLVWCKGKKRRLDKDEKGRIRSNLIPLWHRGFMNHGKNLTSSRREFLENLKCYQVRKPFKITKLMRLLSWENLIFALRKAIDFYRIVHFE